MILAASLHACKFHAAAEAVAFHKRAPRVDRHHHSLIIAVEPRTLLGYRLHKHRLACACYAVETGHRAERHRSVAQTVEVGAVELRRLVAHRESETGPTGRLQFHHIPLRASAAGQAKCFAAADMVVERCHEPALVILLVDDGAEILAPAEPILSDCGAGQLIFRYAEQEKQTGVGYKTVAVARSDLQIQFPDIEISPFLKFRSICGERFRGITLHTLIPVIDPANHFGVKTRGRGFVTHEQMFAQTVTEERPVPVNKLHTVA